MPDLKPSSYVYDEFTLLRSYLALRGRDRVELPADLEPLIDSVYERDDRADLEPAWDAALTAAKEKFADKIRDQNLKARAFLIPETTDLDDFLNGKSQAMNDEDDPEQPPEIRAATRDSDRSIGLVLVYAIEGKTYFDPEGRRPVDLTREPDFGTLRDLLMNSLTGSNPRVVWRFIKQKPPAVWRKCGPIRFHRVVLLNSEAQCVEDQFTLFYGPSLGLSWFKNSVES